MNETKTELKLIHMEDVVSKEVSWLWYPYIPFGKITVVEGDPGEGKTTLILKIAALLSKGLPLPCTDDIPYEPMAVLYQTAEDITQETFIKAWEILPTLQEERAAKSWLMKICYRQFLMKVRGKSIRPEELVEDLEQLERESKIITSHFPSPQTEVIVEESIRELQNGCFLAMVRKLTLHQRIAFSLVDMYGMGVEDVAQILDTTVPAVKGLLYRARMNLDSFFCKHCNLIDRKNLCSCHAWVRFSQKRESLQEQNSTIVQQLNYKKKYYRYDSSTRQKVRFLYKNMPEKQPPEDWYQDIFRILSEYPINPNPIPDKHQNTGATVRNESLKKAVTK